MNKKRRIILFSIFILIIIGLTIYFFPYMLSLRHEETRLKLQEWVTNIGVWGWLLMVLLQAAQIVIAFLPGEPVEIIMGIMYGPIWGTLTCFLGIIIGTVIIYGLANSIGKPFISLFINPDMNHSRMSGYGLINPDKLNDYKFIKNNQKKEAIIFTLFLIPATPKDLLTYLAPIIKMNLPRFLVITLIARIPSVVSSTIFGDSISKGNWLLMGIVFVVTIVIGVIGFFVNKVYMKKHSA